jgi:hypothetical protein
MIHRAPKATHILQFACFLLDLGDSSNRRRMCEYPRERCEYQTGCVVIKFSTNSDPRASDDGLFVLYSRGGRSEGLREKREGEN